MGSNKARVGARSFEQNTSPVGNLAYAPHMHVYPNAVSEVAFGILGKVVWRGGGGCGVGEG